MYFATQMMGSKLSKTEFNFIHLFQLFLPATEIGPVSPYRRYSGQRPQEPVSQWDEEFTFKYRSLKRILLPK